MSSSLIDQAKTWCVGKQWWWRSLLLVWFGFVFVGLLQNPNNSNLFGPFNLCIHEMGHLIFAWSGQFLQFAGGTIVQLAAPIFGMWNFYRQKDFFAITLCFGWLSTNLFNVSYYMADARAMQIALVSIGGGDGGHDWNYLFGHMGLLQYDHSIAGFVWVLAVLSMLVSFFCGGCLIWTMIALKTVDSKV